MPILPPVLPFVGFKWRWASHQPTEGLNHPPVFLGVLRALAKCEGQAKSSQELYVALQKVETELSNCGQLPARLTLARAPDRNLLRNAGQYWLSFELLQDNPGDIQLTDLGRAVASGQVPWDDLVAAVVRTHRLPNPAVMKESEVAAWRAASVEVFPLRLILQVLVGLASGDAEAAHLTVQELCGIVIPLSATNASVSTSVNAIRQARRDILDMSMWPDCTPGANDQRIAAEFLLFLGANDIGIYEKRDPRPLSRLRLPSSHIALVGELLEHVSTIDGLRAAIYDVQEESLGGIVARGRRLVSVLDRSQQQRFRAKVMEHHGARCLLSGESTLEALEAAHIVPVKYGGGNEADNGIPLRADLHALWDAGLLNIRANGEIRFADRIPESSAYHALPRQVDIPRSIIQRLEWRDNYR